MTPEVQNALIEARSLAENAGHPWPGIAAAEAALETSTLAGGWFTSLAYRIHHNALGITPSHDYDGNIFLSSTHEFLAHGEPMPGAYHNPRQPQITEGGVMWLVDRAFCSFDTLEDCFLEQVKILKTCVDYAAAWHCPTPECWNQLVSVHWASGLRRGQVVQAIFQAHRNILT